MEQRKCALLTGRLPRPWPSGGWRRSRCCECWLFRKSTRAEHNPTYKTAFDADVRDAPDDAIDRFYRMAVEQRHFRRKPRAIEVEHFDIALPLNRRAD
jgi:hypothetical protein